MQIDLAGTDIALIGERNPVLEAAEAALRANGGHLGTSPGILVVSCPIVPTDALDLQPLLDEARAAAGLMAASERGGRIVFLVSAAASMPMRRHPRYSMEMARAITAVRSLAMEFGPQVLVNAVGVGVIGELPLAGDDSMLSHASVSRRGTVAEVVDTLLFFCDPLNSYTTGQMLSVDGGWSAGYGRNF